MHLLYTDETNLDPANEFFVYAGVTVPGERAAALSAAIDTIRKKHGYKPNDLLKANTKERPQHITPAVHAAVKQEILQAAATHGANLLASFILHTIATTPEQARRNEINRISLHFDYYLQSVNDYGIVLIDTFTDGLLNRFLREKFGVGLVGMPYGIYRLKRILGFHVAGIGQSNFCSLVDIVVGTLRYAINESANPAKAPTVNQMMALLSPLAVRWPNGKVKEVSFFFSPKQIRVPSYLSKYQGLHSFFASHGIDCDQIPTGP